MLMIIICGFRDKYGKAREAEVTFDDVNIIDPIELHICNLHAG
jgi:hypothetical protein